MLFGLLSLALFLPSFLACHLSLAYGRCEWVNCTLIIAGTINTNNNNNKITQNANKQRIPQTKSHKASSKISERMKITAEAAYELKIPSNEMYCELGQIYPSRARALYISCVSCTGDDVMMIIATGHMMNNARFMGSVCQCRAPCGAVPSQMYTHTRAHSRYCWWLDC